MKNGKPQCKDIPTLPILEFVRDYGGIGCVWFEPPPIRTVGEFARYVRDVMPKRLPDALVHAKMRHLIYKGLIDGCTCGCRGDYEITDKGRARIAELRMPHLHGHPPRTLMEEEDQRWFEEIMKAARRHGQ